MLSIYKIAFVVARSLVIDGKPTPDDPDPENPLHSHNSQEQPLPGLGSPWNQAATMRKPRRQQPTARSAERQH